MAIYEQTVAFAGMKVNSELDNVESYPATEAVPFGKIVVADGEGVKSDVGTGVIRGGSVATDVTTGGAGEYAATDTVGVMTRGKLWMVAGAEGATELGQVYVDGNGFASDDEGTPALVAVPGAYFRSGGAKGDLVQVQFDYPLA